METGRDESSREETRAGGNRRRQRGRNEGRGEEMKTDGKRRREMGRDEGQCEEIKARIIVLALSSLAVNAPAWTN